MGGASLSRKDSCHLLLPAPLACMSTMKKKNNHKLSKNLSGTAGEYFVAAELSRRGWLASIALRGSEAIDILAIHPRTHKQVTIQVKTRQGIGTKWTLQEKAEDLHGSHIFYVFVRLSGEKDRPEFYVVPSRVVARHVRRGQRIWLSKNKRDGRPRKNTSLRHFSAPKDSLDAWNKLAA